VTAQSDFRRWIRLAEAASGDDVVLKSFAHDSTNSDADAFNVMFEVGHDEIKSYIEVWPHRDEDDNVDPNWLDVEIVSIKVGRKSGTRPEFKTTFQTDTEFPSPYENGIRIGPAAVRSMLRKLIARVEDCFGTPVAGISGERVTGASANKSLKQRNKYMAFREAEGDD
jgi:hypothetical protein